MRSVWSDMPVFMPNTPTQQAVNASTPIANGETPPANVDPNDPALQAYLAQLRKQMAAEDAINNQMMEQQRQNSAAAQQDIAAQQGQLEGYKKLPIGTDLSPVASMLDSWYGTHQASNYAPKETPQSRMEQIRQLQAGINKARGAFNDSEISLLKTRLNAEANKEAAALRALQARNTSKQMTESKKERDDLAAEGKRQHLRDKLTNSDDGKTVDGFITFRDTIRQMREYVQKNGVPTSGAGLAAFDNLMAQAKIAAKDKFDLGAITDSDAKLIGGLLGKEGGWTAVLQSKVFRGGTEGTVRALKQLESATDSSWNRKMKRMQVSHPQDLVKPIMKEYETQYSSVKGAQSASDSAAPVVDDEIVIIE